MDEAIELFIQVLNRLLKALFVDMEILKGISVGNLLLALIIMKVILNSVVVKPNLSTGNRTERSREDE